MYLCVLCGSENKQRLFPYTALIDVCMTDGVFTARYGVGLYVCLQLISVSKRLKLNAIQIWLYILNHLHSCPVTRSVSERLVLLFTVLVQQCISAYVLLYLLSPYIIKLNKTGKSVPQHVIKTRRAAGRAPLILNLGIRGRWMVCFTVWPLYLQEKQPQVKIEFEPGRVT